MTELAVCLSVEQAYFLGQNVTTVLHQIENRLSYQKKINHNGVFKYFVSMALQSLQKTQPLET